MPSKSSFETTAVANPAQLASMSTLRVCVFLSVVAQGLAVTPASIGPAGNVFVSPSDGESVANSKPFTLRWTPTTSGLVDLVLKKGSPPELTTLYPLAEGYGNNGSFSWTPLESLPTGLVKYTVELIDQASGQYQYSKTFTLYGSNVPERQMNSPSVPAMPASEAPLFPPLQGKPSELGSKTQAPAQAPS